MSTPDNTVKIFDTTLRDGEQSPGCSMTLRQKIKVAHALADLGVDIIEAGFPAASPGDFEAVRRIAEEVEGPIICGLARCVEGDIKACSDALAPATKKRLHVFISTSPIHREHKLKKSKKEIIQQAVDHIKLARKTFDDVEFSAEDGMRTEPDYLAEIFSAAIAAGATTLNVPDTVGYTSPGEIREMFAYLKDNVKNIDKAVLSIHCHDDLGLAVANSLEAVKAGARQIECTINGIGERAGNCAMEEVVMSFKTRPDLYKVSTGINTRKLYPTSRLVSDVTGSHVARNKAIVGENAFAHESGIHQHGMLMNRATYEIMQPEDVGILKSSLVLGKHSGRHAFRERAQMLGFDDLSDEAMENGFEQFKRLADKKKEVFDTDVEAILMGIDHDQPGLWSLQGLKVNSGLGEDSVPSATVNLVKEDGSQHEETATGDGPIDAVFKALERIADMELTLADYQIRSVSLGEDAQGQADVNVEYRGRFYKGRGLSTDIIEASALAFLEVVNRIIRTEEHRLQQGSAA